MMTKKTNSQPTAILGTARSASLAFTALFLTLSLVAPVTAAAGGGDGYSKGQWTQPEESTGRGQNDNQPDLDSLADAARSASAEVYYPFNVDNGIKMAASHCMAGEESGFMNSEDFCAMLPGLLGITENALIAIERTGQGSFVFHVQDQISGTLHHLEIR